MQKKAQTQGIVIREQTVGESDRLVTVLTRDLGVVRAFARRAKNYKDSKNAATGLLCYSRLDLYIGREKYIINAAYPIEVFFELRQDIVRLALGQYFCELAAQLIPDGVESADGLRLVLNALHFLCHSSRRPELLKPIVELRMLSFSGYMPNLVGCAVCGRYEAPQMLFLVDQGILVCGDCAKPPAGPARPLSPGALMGMRHIVYSDFEKIFSFQLTGSALRQLFQAAEAYVLSILQKRPGTLEFYHSLTAPGGMPGER